MFENMFENALKEDKRSTIVYAQEKKVDKDAMCPINVISKKCTQLRHRQDSTENCILEPKIAF